MKYKTILADPPWKLCTGGQKSLAVHTHYPVQKKDEVIEYLDSLEDDDDVQNVFSNVNVEDN